MALAGVSKATLRQRAFTLYNEEVGGGAFTTTAINTFLQEATQEFVLRSRCLVGSARVARSSKSSSESLVAIPTSMPEITEVAWERHVGANARRGRVVPTTATMMSLRQGADWAFATDSTVGTAAEKHRWYPRGTRSIGIWPPSLSCTAGTLIMWGPKIPDLMTASENCPVQDEFCPGIVYLTCQRMAESDADADPEKVRSVNFAGRAKQYVVMAGGRE